MSDDEEMSDMSQLATQSGSIAYTSFSLSNNEPEPWGRILIHKIIPRRLGVRILASYDLQEVLLFDLIKEKTTFGRSGCDCNISEHIDSNKLQEVSSVHFSIIKNNVTDGLCPVFLEDTSKNGTFYNEKRNKNAEIRCFSNLEHIDEKFKRRILAHKDLIYVEKKPTICFEFQSFHLTTNNLPDEINKEYHIGQQLGQGGCGTVYFAQNRRTCQPFALKFTTSENDENTVSTILKEVDILQRLSHPCILKLFKTQTYINSVAIFIDFMQGGDLLARIQRNGPFSESLTKFLFYQICCGVEYLHSKNVTHRDLKPENILLATTDRYTLVKVSDFGLSKHVTSNSILKTQCGTIMYFAPEIRSAKYTNKVDIWSLGVVLFNCFTNRYPFQTSNNQYELKFDHDEWKNVSDEGKHIVRETLRVDAEQRPSANQLLHERNWLSKTDKYVQKACEIILNPIKSK